MASTLSCSSDGSPDGVDDTQETGSLAVRLSTAPDDAVCLKLSVKGSRELSKNFKLTPGKAETFELDRLPVGIARVDAAAHSSECNDVDADTVAAWVTEAPVKVRIDALDAAKIVLKLLHNGLGDVSVDFEAPAWMSTAADPIDVAVIGDTPYGAAQLEDFPNLLGDIAADARITSIVHVGDIKNGSSRCDDEYFAQIFAGFSGAAVPLIFTPGDNEWTDCHRANNGAYDPLERLAKLREQFYPIPGLALGAGFKQVLTQAELGGFEKFVENQLWYEAQIAFGTIHVVGSNDSGWPWYGDDRTGTKVDEPTRRNAERLERNAANLSWLQRMFDVATEHEAKGVVIYMQADMFDAAGSRSAEFDSVVQKNASLSKAFGKPVLLIEGDSHLFVSDTPLLNGNAAHHVSESVPNLKRLVVQGSTTTPLSEWLRLHIDPSSTDVFSWERNAR